MIERVEGRSLGCRRFNGSAWVPPDKACCSWTRNYSTFLYLTGGKTCWSAVCAGPLAGAKYERDKFVKLLQMKRQKEQQQQQQSATAPAAESASLDGGTHAARVTSSQQSFGLE